MSSPVRRGTALSVRTVDEIDGVECARATCHALPTQRMILLSPSGDRTSSDDYCDRHCRELSSVLLPKYGRGEPAYRVELLSPIGDSRGGAT